MLRLLAPIAVLPLVLAAPSAHSQTMPSANDIIRQLTPTPDSLRASPSRGLRVMSDDRAATSPAPTGKVSAPAMQDAVTAPPARLQTQAVSMTDAPTVSLTVNFATGSAELTPEAVQTLDTLGQALSSDQLSRYRFRIEGHTDTVGTRASNLALSSRRAEAVVNFIETKYNVPATRLQAIGMGVADLLVPTPDQTPEPRNRRVQIVNIGG